MKICWAVMKTAQHGASQSTSVFPICMFVYARVCVCECALMQADISPSEAVCVCAHACFGVHPVSMLACGSGFASVHVHVSLCVCCMCI